jgi:hypothetical protein
MAQSVRMRCKPHSGSLNAANKSKHITACPTFAERESCGFDKTGLAVFELIRGYGQLRKKKLSLAA